MEFGSVIAKSGNVWNRYATRDAAQAFVDETRALAEMYVVCRWIKGEQHGPWVQVSD